MVAYIGLFFVTVILGIILTGKNPTKGKTITYLVISFGLMYFLTVFRYGLGNDYFSYMRIFSEIAENDLGTALTLGYEPLFVILTKAITLISTNPEVMYGIYAVLILAPVAFAIYKYSDKVWISVTVFICLTFFYTQLSFIRQSMAVSVLILAYGFMKKRKIVPVLIMAVVAVLFHYTALVFIPFYLLSLIKPTKKYLITYSSISVGVLVTCLIMKAVGANPLNILANIVTAVTGKDYTGYIGSQWFENGFGVHYLIMPLAVLALVMISYFLGWKEREESDMLLNLTLMNASVWSFITYAFIVERFSMFIFIFAVFTIPSVLRYFEEKAELAQENAVKPDKTMPGYSKKKSEEKKDNSFLVTTVTVIGMFIYNCWGLAMNFHGVFPYMCLNPAVQDAIDGYGGSAENLEVMATNADVYTYLVQLKNTDCGYMIVSTSDSYKGFTPAIRRAADYADTSLNEGTADTIAKHTCYTEYNSRNGEAFSHNGNTEYTAANGITVNTGDKSAEVSDNSGKVYKIKDNKLAFLLFDENGNIFDATEFEVSSFARIASKLEAE